MKIAIIGGGFCGLLVAKKLEKIEDLEVTLIDKKSYFEYQPSFHKLIFEPARIHKLKVDYNICLEKTKIIVDEVVNVGLDKLTTKNRTIKFDILVITTGIDYPIFLDNKENVHVLKTSEDAMNISRKIVTAKEILIVGAGLIGAEVAGEILTKAPEKKLTIVHPYQSVLKRMSDDASSYTINFLEKNGAKLILGEKVIDHNDKIFVTNKGREINADLCIWSAGIRCNPNYMSDFPKNCFSDKNALNVNQCLQLEGYTNIFVGGDIISIIEEKTARKAEIHAKFIAKNIRNILEDKPLKTYKIRRSPMVVGLGDWSGIIFYKYTFPGLFVPGILKWLIEWWFLRLIK
jgi:NADH dehydrogenase FAD-containing subunit